MQRHEALQDLSRDHHHGLVAAQRLVRSAEGHDRADDPSTEAERFLAFWDEELAWHFTEEEQVLLPVYQRYVDLGDDGGVVRMLEDHAWFRDAVPALEAALDAGQDVTGRIRVLGERLSDHARFEDRDLFQRIEETLSEADLQEIHERSMAFRRSHRGDDAIGPR